MTDEMDARLKLYELYLGTTEKIGDQRAQANSWMLSVNSAIVALYGYLQADKAVVGPDLKGAWLWAIPSAGLIVSLAWAGLLVSYRKLHRTKFEVLAELEKELPAKVFTQEEVTYHKNNRWSLSYVETVIPLCFLLLYAVVLGAALCLARDAP